MGYYIATMRTNPPMIICVVPGTLERAIHEAERLWNALQDPFDYGDEESIMEIDYNWDGAHGLEIHEDFKYKDGRPVPLEEGEVGKLILRIDYTTHER